MLHAAVHRRAGGRERAAPGVPRAIPLGQELPGVGPLPKWNQVQNGQSVVDDGEWLEVVGNGCPNGILHQPLLSPLWTGDQFCELSQILMVRHTLFSTKRWFINSWISNGTNHSSNESISHGLRMDKWNHSPSRTVNINHEPMDHYCNLKFTNSPQHWLTMNQPFQPPQGQVSPEWSHLGQVLCSRAIASGYRSRVLWRQPLLQVQRGRCCYAGIQGWRKWLTNWLMVEYENLGWSWCYYSIMADYGTMAVGNACCP